MRVRWLHLALMELGDQVAEIPGPGDNPRIAEYHSVTTLPVDLASQDATPWCSSFVAWTMERAGLQSPRSARARSWLDWGKRLEAPRLGCVVVFRRGQNPAAGHVGYWCGERNGLTYTLGGNQRDRVSVARYHTADVLGYRWPLLVAGEQEA